jgi:D-alanyl-lipoteichoic acid acyltransferase DltB (MBOAT superfamily)
MFTVLIHVPEANLALTHAKNMTKPKSVENAVQAMWVTNAASLLVIFANFDEASLDSLVVNGLFLLVYVIVTVRISAGRNRARLLYAFLVAIEVAMLMAFGLSEASELEIVLTYFSLPLEAWILIRLFGAESDKWFATQNTKPHSKV